MDIEQLLAAQLDLERTAYDQDPVSLEGTARMDFVRWNALALTDELHEALGECNWKPWADSTRFDGPAMLKELIDVMFFLSNLLLVAGADAIDPSGDMSAEDLVPLIAAAVTAEYKAKTRVNRARQADGYDGISSKCPVCRRAFEDMPPVFNEDDGLYMCIGCHATWSEDADGQS